MGQLTRLPRMASQTPDLTRAIDLVKKALDPLLQQPFDNGTLVGPVTVTAATAFVANHNLGRSAVGAVVVTSTGSAMMVVRPVVGFTPPPNPHTQLALQPSATGTVTLWVF